MPSHRTSTSSHHPHRYTHRDSDGEESSEISSFVSSGSGASSTVSSEQAALSKLPTLPDLRFEQSYLATIRGFLHEDQPHAEFLDASEEEEKGEDHHHKVELTRSSIKDGHELWLGNLRVEWFPIMYVTVRDQLLSPLIQGAVWGLGGLLLAQFRQYLSASRARRAARRGARGPPPSILRLLGLSQR